MESERERARVQERDRARARERQRGGEGGEGKPTPYASCRRSECSGPTMSSWSACPKSAGISRRGHLDKGSTSLMSNAAFSGLVYGFSLRLRGLV